MSVTQARRLEALEARTGAGQDRLVMIVSFNPDEGHVLNRLRVYGATNHFERAPEESYEAFKARVIAATSDSGPNGLLLIEDD
jgi:hypothetical protein